jgi:hypothetical protein
MTAQELMEVRSICKEAGRHIDPTTAEVDWKYGPILDPYGIGQEIPEEGRCIGRLYFARAPGSDIWVWFGDLLEATSKALWERHKQKLAFPAGLPLLRETPLTIAHRSNLRDQSDMTTTAAEAMALEKAL